MQRDVTWHRGLSDELTHVAVVQRFSVGSRVVVGLTLTFLRRHLLECESRPCLPGRYRVDGDDASGLFGVGGGVCLDQKAPGGVADKQVGARQLCDFEKPVKVGGNAPVRAGALVGTHPHFRW